MQYERVTCERCHGKRLAFLRRRDSVDFVFSIWRFLLNLDTLAGAEVRAMKF
jgi:hypothetical protein